MDPTPNPVWPIIQVESGSPAAQFIGPLFENLYEVGASLIVVAVALIAVVRIAQLAFAALSAANNSEWAGGADWESGDLNEKRFTVFGALRSIAVGAATTILIAAGAFFALNQGPQLLYSIGNGAGSVFAGNACQTVNDPSTWLTDGQSPVFGTDSNVCLFDAIGPVSRLLYTLQLIAGNAFLVIGAIIWALNWIKALNKIRLSDVAKNSGAEMDGMVSLSGGATRFKVLMDTLQRTTLIAAVAIIGFVAIKFGPNWIYEVVTGIQWIESTTIGS
jgi:hypothetical protein